MNANQALRHFQNTFRSEPDAIASAPGRVNLIGEHTDYNGGQVLPMAIDRRTYVAMRSAPDARASRIVSDNEAEIAEFDVRSIARTGKWWDYITGVCASITAGRKNPEQLEIAIVSDLPAGSGLSSSAALELATSAALSALVGGNTAPQELALLSWRAETGFVGVSCGVMDQFASALGQTGHALHLWCDTLETHQVPMKESVLIFDTNAPRSLRGSEFNVRQEQCVAALRLLREHDPQLKNLAAATPDQVRAARMPRTLEMRALHVTEENARVGAVVAALETSGTIPGEVLLASHASLRTQYECSTPELDWFVENVMASRGVRGARLTGAGWGGCAIAVGDHVALANAARALSAEYQTTFGRSPRTWLTKADQGAHLESTRDDGRDRGIRSVQRRRLP
jgi:galactokinase